MSDHFDKALVLSTNLLRSQVDNRKTMGIHRRQAESVEWFRGMQCVPQDGSGDHRAWDLASGPIVACSSGLKRKGMLKDFRLPSGILDLRPDQFLKFNVPFVETEAGAVLWQLAPDFYDIIGDDMMPWMMVVCFVDQAHYAELKRSALAGVMAKSGFAGAERFDQHENSDRRIKVKPQRASNTADLCRRLLQGIQPTKTSLFSGKPNVKCHLELG